MPSGAKKRKAAKKKKENQTSSESKESTASTRSHGEEEMKHQEDEIGDVTSPEKILGKEEELIEKDRGSSNSSSTEGSRIHNGEKRTVPEEGIFPVERNFKIGDGLDGKDGGIEGKSYSCRSMGSDYENQASVKNCEPAGDISVSLFVHSSSTSGESDEWVMDLQTVYALMKQIEEEKRLIHVDERGGNSSSSTKATSEREDGEFTDSFESTAATIDQKGCVAHENDHTLAVPKDLSSSTADNRAEHARDLGITEPLLAPSPRLVQKTSWKGCCGLFDLFSGSGA